MMDDARNKLGAITRKILDPGKELIDLIFW
jgi:hypothetical protein